jgi:hypothetical protein
MTTPFRSDDTIDEGAFRTREFNYWIVGLPRRGVTSRWSIVRDVLHWRN